MPIRHSHLYLFVPVKEQSDLAGKVKPFAARSSMLPPSYVGAGVVVVVVAAPGKNWSLRSVVFVVGVPGFHSTVNGVLGFHSTVSGLPKASLRASNGRSWGAGFFCSSNRRKALASKTAENTWDVYSGQYDSTRRGVF